MGDSAQAMKKTAPTETRIEWMDIDKIPPHPENPKAHDLPAIMASMRAFGFRGAVILDEASGLTNEGHGRVQALKLMRSEDARNAPKNVRVEGNVKSAQKSRWLIPVVRGQAFANEDEARAFLIASNRLTELGGWSASALARLHGELSELGTGLVDVLGFTSHALEAMIGAFEIASGEFPEMRESDGPAFKQITFILTPAQYETVQGAMHRAGAPLEKKAHSADRALSLVRLCEAFRA
jgi:hypothetical protein